MKIIFLFLFLISNAYGKESPISIVYIDEASEKKLGDFPISRDHYAKAIRIMREQYRPHSIVLNLFLDIPRPEDKELKAEITKSRNVYTQAYAEDGDPFKGEVPLESIGKNTHKLKDFNSGWIPARDMAIHYKAIGFVNGRANQSGETDGFFLINSILGNVYPSLPLVLARDFKKTTLVYKGTYIELGNKKVKLHSDGSIDIPPLPAEFSWKTYSFLDLLEGRIGKEELRNKIVMIYYSGKKVSPTKLTNGKTMGQAEGIALITDYLMNL